MQLLVKTVLVNCHKQLKKYAELLIRIILQGTVDINLGTDCLAGPKALDPNYCKQPTVLLQDLCLEVLTVHGTELRLFGAKTIPLLIPLMSHISHSSSRYNF